MLKKKASPDRGPYPQRHCVDLHTLFDRRERRLEKLRRKLPQVKRLKVKVPRMVSSQKLRNLSSNESKTFVFALRVEELHPMKLLVSVIFFLTTA